MKIGLFLGVAMIAGLLTSQAFAAQIGVTEIAEGTVRTVYVDKPMVGARGYVVADWEAGDVRVEVKDFPASDSGYEVFLFEIDVKAYMGAMFVDGDPRKGIVAEPPPFEAAAALISQWKSIGDLSMSSQGNGQLAYKGGGNLAATGLNMIMIFEKVSAGMHDGPEDFSKLMVECNGPLGGLASMQGMEHAIKVYKH